MIDQTLKDEMASPAEKKFDMDWLKKVSPEVRTGRRNVGLSEGLQKEISLY